ncbi:MAG: aspartate--tRNA ligase [Chloroflexi bacterium]|nr:aspartate--tRNA ligase [Chloroflexota bacterium]
MLKSHRCGELRPEHAGERVLLAGWVHRRRDHGGLVFLDLRDESGLVQVVCHPTDAPGPHAVASTVRSEWVLAVEGEVARRREGTVNEALPTGAVEVAALEVRVLSEAATPPIPVNQETAADEATRLRYRYLDLRRGRMAANLRLRHRVVQGIRRYLDERGFVEVETPMLSAATPEGARDYLVPSRIHPGRFYALPQSPQQWKQLLVVAGFERYYQIARCFRDEDLRADRQPEFTQLDIEMAFVEQRDVLELVEGLYTELSGELAPERSLPRPFPRIPYAEAMERFGTDKPDLRYGMEIADLSEPATAGELGIFRQAVADGGRVRGIAVPGGAGTPRRELDRLTGLAREAGAGGLVPVAYAGSGPLEGLAAEEVRSPVARFFDEATLAGMGRLAGARRGDLLLAVAAPDDVSSRALDVLRRELAATRGLADEQRLAYCFVTDFPLVEWDARAQRWQASHHLFTAPAEEDLGLLESDPGAVRSLAYDLVCNGQELASGSIRTHRPEVLLAVMGVLGIDEAQARERFGHMLEAFGYGAPPHGGIAPGLDRTVALFAGERDIREVIAFPKTKTASDPLTGAPSAVDPAQLAEVHVELRE